MKYVVIVSLVLVWLAQGLVYAQEISITAPARFAMQEGEDYRIEWNTKGDVESVSVVAHGPRTPLGSESRGDFEIVIAESVPADQEDVDWTVPWIDAASFFIKLKGFDSEGKQVAITERGYGFRPEVMADRMEDGIFLDLHKQTDQRLYVQENYKITHAYLSSSSKDYYWLPASRHINAPHDHAGVYSVLEKKRLHHSRLFDVDMPYAMRYHSGHFIHATSPNLYINLGIPASSGCNRMTEKDARELYNMTPVGTRVEVIGPDG